MLQASSKHPDRILIVGPSWVGDMVMAQSLFKELKRLHPQCYIDVLAPAWSRPLLDRMPEVARGIDMPVGHGQLLLKERYRLGVSLRAEKYDQAILLPNSLKSALIPAFAEIEIRTGWRGEWRYGLLSDIRKLDKKRYPLMVQRFIALAHSAGTVLPEKALDFPLPELVVDAALRADVLKKYQLNTKRPILVLCPGAEFGPAKRWPEQHYAEVASQKIQAGWQVWLMGSQKDVEVCQTIKAYQSNDDHLQVHNLAGVTALAEAIDLMSLADCVVSNDSGLMHIAAALGRPLVGVYGSTSPKFTPPLSDQVSIESVDVDCRPCFSRECPKTPESGYMQCLETLSAQKVLAAIDNLCAGVVKL